MNTSGPRKLQKLIFPTVRSTERYTEDNQNGQGHRFYGTLSGTFAKDIKIIYGTPYIHTPTYQIERGVSTLKENLITNIKAGERLGKVLDMSSEVLRKTPHTRPRKSTVELHYRPKPNKHMQPAKARYVRKLQKFKTSAKPDISGILIHWSWRCV